MHIFMASMSIDKNMWHPLRQQHARLPVAVPASAIDRITQSLLMMLQKQSFVTYVQLSIDVISSYHVVRSYPLQTSIVVSHHCTYPGGMYGRSSSMLSGSTIWYPTMRQMLYMMCHIVCCQERSLTSAEDCIPAAMLRPAD